MGFSDNSGMAGRLIQVVVIIGGLALALVFGNLVAGGSYQALALIFAVVGGLVLYMGFSKYFWMICFASIFLPGQITFMPLGLKLFEVFLIAGVIHFTIDQVAFRKNFPQVGRQPDGFLLIAALLIVLYHAFKDRLGVRLLGSDTWGGRGYLSAIFAAAAYFCLQAIKLDGKAWSKMPAIILGMGCFDLLIKLISVLSPRAGDLISMFYLGTFEEDALQDYARFGFLGNFGYILIATAFSYASVGKLISQGRMVPAAMFILGGICVLASGYRSALIFGGTLFLVGGLRDLKWRVLPFLLLGVLSLLVVSWTHSSIFRLPPGIQRGLVWIPGDWDHDLKTDAAGSDEFRIEVWTYWAQKYFPEHPLIGRGMGMQSSDVMAGLASTMLDPSTGKTIQKFADRSASFSLTGNLHNGFLSTVDRFGILGALAIFIWSGYTFFRFVNFVMRDREMKQNRTLHWISIYGCAWIVCFPLGALRIDDFLPVLILLVGIFNSLLKSTATKPVPKPALQESSDANVPAHLPGRMPFPHRRFGQS